MNYYTETISIKLPAELAEIAAKIGRALDPDTGGEKSFSLDPSDLTPGENMEVIYPIGVNNTSPSPDGLTISTSTPCTAEFKAQAEWMLIHPEALHAACAADYAARWPDLVPLTLEECEAFCNGVIADPLPEVLTV